MADTVGGTAALRDAGASRSRCGLLDRVRRRWVGNGTARGLIGARTLPRRRSKATLEFVQAPNSHARSLIRSWLCGAKKRRKIAGDGDGGKVLEISVAFDPEAP